LFVGSQSVSVEIRTCYFIPLVRVSFINVGSGFFFFKNLNFSFVGANIPILFIGSQSL
jgi:hypothetical protein